jgi:hypothetical protein
VSDQAEYDRIVRRDLVNHVAELERSLSESRAREEGLRAEAIRAVENVAAQGRLVLRRVGAAEHREDWARSEIDNEERLQIAALRALASVPADAPKEKP